MDTDSQRLQLLRALSKGQRITPHDAFIICGSIACSQRIGELVRDGWPITRGRLRVGPRTIVGEYWIPAAQLAKVRKELKP